MKQLLGTALSLLLIIPPSGAQPPEAPRLRIVIVEGDGAVNNVRQRVAREPIVEVHDENDRPVAGAVVVFTLPERGASASFLNGSKFLTVVADENGRAVARGLQPNSVAGDYEIRVSASHQGKTGNGVIRQTNAAAAGIATGKLIAILAAVGGGVVAGVLAATGGKGSSSSSSSGGGVTTPPPVTATTITPGAGSVTPPR
ncbi:MAG: carboxypeptidase-like regulatory domain-containing protein [Bryobacteraceae bacterium]